MQYKIDKFQIKNLAISFIDILISPLVLVIAYLTKFIRRKGIQRFKISRAIFRKAGIMPVSDHYYDPFYNPKPMSNHFRNQRVLNAINFDLERQINFLSQFNYWNELQSFINTGILNDKGLNLDFPWINPIEAELYYSIIRKFMPSNIIEIGSGKSTIIALEAIKSNKNLNSNYNCSLYCIEPYENKWLENTGVQVIRNKVEELNISFFDKLNDGDILFIDSSHIIKPNGDVVYEYLELLPSLNKGVFVHIHDIFSPFNYPDKWLIDEVSFWNEQYLLEAFLTCNKEFEIISALNYLAHNNEGVLKNYLKSSIDYINFEPSSFWLRKI